MSKIPTALTSAKTYEHQTPFDLFDALDKEFGPFTLDPATALGYHTSDVILARGGSVATLDGHFNAAPVASLGLRPYLFDIRNGLERDWTGRVFVNPPFGRGPKGDCWQFVHKAYKSVREGDADLVCAVLPVKSDMRWWQRYILAEVQNVRHYNRSSGSTWSDPDIRTDRPMGADIVRFIPGRLKFELGNSGLYEKVNSAPMPCAVVVWAKPGILDS